MGPVPKPWSLARIMSRTARTDAGCIEWIGAKSSAGYGQIRTGGRIEYAHRLVYAFSFGSPSGFDVCHRCDNPPCCNPDHLFLGSARDNIIDMRTKGRHGTAKITQEIAESIRRDLSVSSQGELAAKYGLSQAQISDIKLGRCWGQIPRKDLARKRHLDAASVVTIRARYDTGEAPASIGKDFGITRYQVANIGKRKQWKNV